MHPYTIWFLVSSPVMIHYVISIIRYFFPVMNIYPPEGEKRHGLQYITPAEDINQSNVTSFLYGCIEHIANAIESNYTNEYRVLYINSTIPQSLNESMVRLKATGKYSWLDNEKVMRSFKYERISDIGELNSLIDKTPANDMIIIENLQRILKNSTSDYNRNNEKLIHVVQAIKQTNSYIIDFSHHWFINLLL